MPVAVGYTYDTFLSYAHVDDLPTPNSDDGTGWVTIFYETLASEVRQRLGRTDVELWKDNGLEYHHSLTQQLITTVRSSAVLIVMLSPGYIRSEWCGRERDTFMGVVRSRGDAPVFVVAKEWIADADVPEGLRDYRRFPFFTGSESDWTTFGYPRPNPADPRHAIFYDNIVKLSREIAGVLNTLAASPASPPKPSPEVSNLPPPKIVAPVTASPTGKRVFLAETTDDLEGDRDMVRAFLDQLGIEVVPPAGVYYPTQPLAFREAVEQDIRSADVFVQLLGEIAGRRPTGLPQGYPTLQWEVADQIAKAGKSLPILQWCSPSLDISAISDEDVAAFLRTPTVRQESRVDFERAILAALDPPKDERPVHATSGAADDPRLVCVNIDSNDRQLAEEIQAVLRRQRTDFISVWFGGSAPDNRELLESGLRDCDGVIVVYGQANESWVDRQLLECRKSRAFRNRPFAALGVFKGPPPDPPDSKPPINVYLDGLEQYDCRGSHVDSSVIEREVQTFLDRLRENASAKAA